MNRIRPKLKENDPDGFLRNISGVIHVGANTGQERKIYRKFGLRVIWIEPIPEVFKILKANLRGFPGQRAMQCLITDRDDEEYRFHIANNKGASSSILDMKHCKKIWPNLNYTDTILLRSTTLVSLFERESINSSNYQALIMDTQGSELLVLKGSIPLLPNFEYVKTEVADFESYAGCCQLADIDSFMTQHGYIEFSLSRLGTRPEGGSYFDIVYKKKAR
ncbi:MAG: FkbM family methyltransferase [Candidatus Marinimicrobia bacterium]|nr:FkbM family methyltransferase [Candidatus Neomarinimicrobiota bacterium]